MQFIQIHNIHTSSGAVDYKGLDIDQFVPGSQYYPIGVDMALVATTEQDISHPDIAILTEQDYQSLIEHYESLKPPTPEQQIKQLQETVDQLVLDALMGGA